jgi:hypothetical protein
MQTIAEIKTAEANLERTVTKLQSLQFVRLLSADELTALETAQKELDILYKKERLEELRAELRAEGISYAETIELQSLEQYIDKHDVELREAAGLPEFEELPADDTYYIEYLNASKRHARDKVEFKTYEEAKQWGKANLENFNSDMIRIKR